jgi:hypothetical protein
MVWTCPASIMDFHKEDIIFGIFYALMGPFAILLCCVIIPIQGYQGFKITPFPVLCVEGLNLDFRMIGWVKVRKGSLSWLHDHIVFKSEADYANFVLEFMEI